MRRELVLATLLAAMLSAAGRSGAEQRVVQGPARVNLRQGPASSTPSIGTVASGEHVRVEREQGAWVLVSTEDGRTGYIWARYLAPTGARTEETGEAEAPDRGGTGSYRAPPTAATIAARVGELCAAVRELGQQRGGSGTGVGPSTRGEGVNEALARLAAGQEELRHLLTSRGAGAQGGPARRPGQRLLAGVGAGGLVVGFLIGAALRRRPAPRSRLRL